MQERLILKKIKDLDCVRRCLPKLYMSHDCCNRVATQLLSTQLAVVIDIIGLENVLPRTAKHMQTCVCKYYILLCYAKPRDVMRCGCECICIRVICHILVYMHIGVCYVAVDVHVDVEAYDVREYTCADGSIKTCKQSYDMHLPMHASNLSPWSWR